MSTYNEDQLREAAANSKSYSETLRALGLRNHGGNIENLKKKLSQFQIDSSHFEGVHKKRKYTKAALEPVVKDSVSISEVLRKFGVTRVGGNSTLLKKRLEEFRIDTSHFLGNQANSGERHRGNVKQSFEKILSKKDTGSRRPAYQLRRALIESGRDYRCEAEGCSVLNDWLGQNLTLQIHHKNGDVLDNRAENLEFLCPNCHTLTDNYCRSNGMTDLTSNKRWSSDYKKRSPQ